MGKLHRRVDYQALLYVASKKRIEDIEQLDRETRNKLFFLIDNVVQNFKTKQAFAK